MADHEPNIVTSSFSRRVTGDGVTVIVWICRRETAATWTLEVVNAAGTSTVWDDLFPSDEAANEEFLRTVADEGMTAFLDRAKVVPFRRRADVLADNDPKKQNRSASSNGSRSEETRQVTDNTSPHSVLPLDVQSHG
jgi:hypothetical protein